MSKRGPGAGFELNKDDYARPSDEVDKPVMATAAQMAKRKLATMKNGGKRPARTSRNNAAGSDDVPLFNAAYFERNGTENDPFKLAPDQVAVGANPFASSDPNNQKKINGAPLNTSTFKPVLNPGSGTFNFGATTSAFGGGNNSFTFGQNAQPQPTSTAPQTNPFGTFGQQQQQQQEAPKPATFGGFGQHQEAPATTFGGFGQQQQPLTATTFSGFGQQPQTPAPTVFNGFGQQQQTPAPAFGGFSQPQQTPATAAFTGFGQQQEPSNANAFAGFVQQQDTNVFAGFGQQAQQDSHQAPSFTAPRPETSRPSSNGGFFAGASQPAPQDSGVGFFNQPAQQNGATALSNGTDSQAQQNGGSGLFGSGFQASQYQQSVPGAKSIFADLPKTNVSSTNGQPYFPPTSTSANEPTTAAAGGLFSGNGHQGQQNGDQSNGSSTANMFGQLNQTAQQNGEQEIPTQKNTPATGHEFVGFGQPAQQNGQQTPSIEAPVTKSSGFMGFGKQAEQNGDHTTGEAQTPKPSAFGGFGQTPATQQKAPLFGLSQTARPASPASGTTFSGFGATKPNGMSQDTSTSENTPPKSSDSAAPDMAEKPAARSLFGLIDEASKERLRQREASRTPAPSNIFAPATSTTSGSEAQPTPSTSQAHGVLEAPESTTPKAPSQALFGSNTQPPPRAAFGLFAPSQPSAPSAPAESSKTSTAAQASSQALTKAAEPLDPEQARFLDLNSCLLDFLKTHDLTQDWTPILRMALQVSVDISGFPSGFAQPGPSAVSTNLFASSNATPAPSSAAFAFGAGNMSSSPAPPPTGQTLSPTMKKRAHEDDDSDKTAPAEKRGRFQEPVKYSKLPENASETSKLFESMLNKATTANATTADTMATNATKLAVVPLFNKGASTGFMPFVPSPAPKSSPANDTTAALKPPTFAAVATGNALSAFGSRAQAQAKNDLNKRKAEEFDSEEDDEETWLAAQAAKFQKLAEAAKTGTGFVPSTSKRTSPPPPAASTAPPPKTPAKTGGNFINNSTTPATAVREPASSMFGGFQPKSGDVAEKAQGDGDHTWKSSAALKFGASTTSSTSAAPRATKTTGLFGSSFIPPSASAQDSTNKVASPATKTSGLFGSSFISPSAAAQDTTNKLAPPTPKQGLGFGFGTSTQASASVSRATSPGVTTDGEASASATGGPKDDGEPSDAVPDAPQDDKAALQPSELEGHDVLFETPAGQKSQCKRLEPDAKGKKVWAVKATGRCYVLKSRDTGKVRILFKQLPLGQVVMNFAPLKAMKYAPNARKPVAMDGAFVDHIGLTNGEAKLAQFMVQFRTADSAAELGEILSRNAQ